MDASVFIELKEILEKEGVDCFETFSPIVQKLTITVVLSIAAQYRWPIYQLDVKNVSFPRELQEEVYMQQP